MDQTFSLPKIIFISQTHTHYIIRFNPSDTTGLGTIGLTTINLVENHLSKMVLCKQNCILHFSGSSNMPVNIIFGKWIIYNIKKQLIHK